MRRRSLADSPVVVTGMGMVTSIGIGREEFWNSLLAGRCGFGPVKSFDTSGYQVHLGAEIRDFKPDNYVHRLNPASIGRSSQFAIAAARLALLDAQIELNAAGKQRTGVCLGTTSGEPHYVERFDDRYVQGSLSSLGDEFIAGYPCHLVPGNVATELELGGETMMIPTACAAGNYAVAHASDVLRMGKADFMLAGGADSFSRITYSGFARLGAIAPEICQPFDRNRKGMVPGEGAAILLLETKEKAEARGARIYCEVAGYGLSCDAHHMTAAHPEGEGAARAIATALRHSGIAAEEVDYISAHGTGTPTNDRLETIAVKKTFGSLAYRIPISSIKSMLGHTMGAASAIESAVCALAITHQQIPATMNLREQDPECDLDYVPNVARKRAVRVAMNNAYAFGGNNSSVIFTVCAA
ncbi:MAG TPA: beta-ketoacyl-[acyl-carrier-protein] synthase family protein [Candidatus Angelobacter sp.]|nr:beta-ketoacyl-[acyl-carrier-protein] synthase family protein [Candidatus Angelobacter sp.]